MRIITIGRQFGSGGRELGKRLADWFGFEYYDREILEEVAKRANMNVDYAERMLLNGSFHGYTLTYGRTFESVTSVSPYPSAGILSVQRSILKEIGEKGDCVIVGRSANAILASQKPFRVFVYADIHSRIERCRSRAESGEENLSDRAYEKKIKKIDRARASRHNLVSSYKWGDPLGYDLCVNTTGVEIKSIVGSVAEYATHYFENNGILSGKDESASANENASASENVSTSTNASTSANESADKDASES